MRIILPEGERKIAVSGQTVESVLVKIGIRPIDVLVSRDGTIIPEDTLLADEDTITVIRIVHGG